MKIVFASQSFYPYIGGVPTYLLNLTKELQKMGNEVVEIHLRPPGESLEEEIKNICVYRVPKEPLKKELLEGYSKFKENFQKAILGQQNNFSGNVMEIEGYEEFYTINQIFGEEVGLLLKNSPAEIVHVHDFQLIFLYKYVPRGTPLILTWHVPFLSNMRGGIREFIIENMMQYDKVVFSSEDYLESAVKAGLPREKAELIYPLANTDLFKKINVDKNKVKNNYGIPNKSKMILCVQRLDWRSSHEQLVKSMPGILKKVPNAVLVFVGGKSMSSKISKCRDIYVERINEMINEFGLKNHIVFTGNIEYSRLPFLYNSADVIASTPQMEAFGLSVTEAMSCGKPVVGTNVGGIPLQIMDNVNGFLVPVGDAKITAEKLILLLQNKKLSEKMGMKSLDIVKERFLMQKGVEAHIGMYQKLLKEKSDMWRLKMMDLDNIEAVLTDFDRTITEKPGVIKSDVVKALKSLKKPLVLVTGRKLKYVKELCKKYPFWKAVVAENGSIVYFPQTEKIVITDSGYMKMARKLVKSSGLKVFAGRVILSSRIENKKPLREFLKPFRRKLVFEKNIDEVMVLPRGVDKGKGVLLALHELGIKPEKTIIIGDAENDVKLFNVPGYRVAVANAHKRLKAIADEVTENASDRGVIEVVEKLRR